MAAAAIETLESFKCSSEALSLREIARDASVSKPTVFRVLHTLTDLGYVNRDIDSGKYSLTLKVLEFAKYVSRANTFRLWALPYMRRLMKQFDMIVNLAIKEGGSITYVEIITSATSEHVPPRVGSTAMWHSTALGKAIASYTPETDVMATLDRTRMPSETRNTIVSKRAYMEELKRVRKQGFAEDNQEHKLGICCMATPIREASGKAVGAISVTSTPAQLSGLRKQEVGEALRTLGQDLSLRLAGNLALTRLVGRRL